MTHPSPDDSGAPADHPPARPALRFAQGLAMGTADVIPGVSGGTVALIVGIYTTLIGAIRSLASAVGALLRGRRGDAGGHWRAVPWVFCLSVGIGIIVAVGIGSVVLPPLLETYAVQTSAVFFGMIVASLVIPWRDAGDRGPRMIALAAAGAVVAFVLTGLPAASPVGDPSTVRIAASAAVAVCALVLPGVSGAFLLVVLGMYEPSLNAIRALDIGYVATFVVGAVVGLGLFAKVLGYLLDHRLAVTMATLTGLMLGALRALWPWGGSDGRLDAPPAAGEAWLALGLAVAGFAVVRTLLWAGDRSGRDYDPADAAPAIVEAVEAVEDELR